MAVDISQFVVMGTPVCTVLLCRTELWSMAAVGHEDGLRLPQHFFCDCFHFTFTLLVNEN